MFLKMLKEMANRGRTENGAATLRSTNSACLDFFATVGAMRSLPEKEIMDRFQRAFTENPDLAMKILFYARDIRGGLGERAVFRTLLTWLAEHEIASLRQNLPFIAEYGRWDDLLVLLDTPARRDAEAVFQNQFQTDMHALEQDEPVSLLGKWLPSINASSEETVRKAKILARAFGLTDAQYRKALSALRKEIQILENSLRVRDYTFEYAKQPSRAMFKYRHAFIRNDQERYKSYLSQVKTGQTAIHTGTLMPYDIVAAAYHVSRDDRETLDVTWNALEDFTLEENAIVVADGSGSMYSSYTAPQPATVAQSLAIYFAERNQGVFHNYFITFSRHPQLIEIKGRDIVEKVNYIRTFDEVANTNLQAVFKLILNTAVNNNVPQRELPATLYIVSDMEFDSCMRDASMTNFEYARRLYRSHGYSLPRIIFWNVQSRNQQQPVKMNELGVALVSGCSPRIFSQVMTGEMDPFNNMLSIINSDRYAQIQAAI